MLSNPNKKSTPLEARRSEASADVQHAGLLTGSSVKVESPRSNLFPDLRFDLWDSALKGSTLDPQKGRTLLSQRFNLKSLREHLCASPKRLNLSIPLILLFFLSIGFFAPQKTLAFTLSKPVGGPTVGLVGWWSFDGKDTVGGTIYDRSGNGNNGSAVNYATSTFFTLGKIGQALNFDGVDDYVNVGNGSVLNPTTKLSISVWINTPAPNTNFALIVDKDSGAVFFQYTLRFDGTTGNVMFRVADNGVGATAIFGTTVIKANQWYFVTATYDGQNLRIYVNGQSDATPAPSTIVMADSGSVVYIGRRSDGGYFPGKIDDVRIYNRALSQAEITQLYNMGLSKQNASRNNTLTSGLVGLWSFDGKDTVGGTIYDRSGQNNHGSAINIATSTFYTQGKIGQALNFDGVDDYVNAGFPASLNDLGPLTYSVWVYPKGDVNTGTVLDKGRIYLQQVSGKWRFFRQNTGTNLFRDSSSNITLNTWTHLVAVWDGDITGGNVHIYLNGVLDDGTLQAGTGSGMSDAGWYQLIGIDSGLAVKFTGIMDDARIYNRALSQREITQLYNMGLSKQNASRNNTLTSGLVGLWSFDGKDTVGGTIYDRSGNGNNGSAVNIATSTFFTLGKIGQALNFDGVNDYVAISPNATLENLGPLTYSAWIYPKALNDGVIDGANIVRRLTRMFALSSIHLPSVPITIRMFISGSVTSGQPFCEDLGITLNTWQHVAVTWNGLLPFTGRFYINGVACSAPVNQLGSGTVTSDTGATQYIGADVPNTSSYFNGKIDDARIYNRQLSQAEITQLYNLGR